MRPLICINAEGASLRDAGGFWGKHVFLPGGASRRDAGKISFQLSDKRWDFFFSKLKTDN